MLLYSGGLDSSYLLKWAVQKKLDVFPLFVHLQPADLDLHLVSALPRSLGVDIRISTAVATFADEYLASGIRANCWYQGIYPISSSMSRPLMARIAVDLARAVDADCVVHTSGAHQNSCARFNNSIASLAPDLLIGNPYLGERLTRESKMYELRGQPGADQRHPYSVDTNIWARVIESGPLDSAAARVPEEVFEWTIDPCLAAREPLEVTLSFVSGLPVAIDGEKRPLVEILRYLNKVGGQYGVGRFNGVEGTANLTKSHEVREAPAAAAILSAHQHLEQLVLTDEEIGFKMVADQKWTQLAVLGAWYSTLRSAIDGFVREMSVLVTGDVGLVYKPGAVHVDRLESEYTLLHQDLAQRTSETPSFAHLTEVSAVLSRIRNRTRSYSALVDPSAAESCPRTTQVIAADRGLL